MSVTVIPQTVQFVGEIKLRKRNNISVYNALNEYLELSAKSTDRSSLKIEGIKFIGQDFGFHQVTPPIIKKRKKQ